jgi:putative N-acetyltransferase (TIGR04045 family)
VGRWLVQTAVGTARAWGAHQFRATVQGPNVAFFRRLHWRSLQELELFGCAHHLMEAELQRYPPTAELRPAGQPGATDVAA